MSRSRQPSADAAKRVLQAARVRKAARYKRDEDVSARRRKEQACAWRFLLEGEPHERCVHPQAPCSREYDPGGRRISFPEGTKMYEGTGIGFLYGLTGSEVHAWQTAGWNIKRRRVRS